MNRMKSYEASTRIDASPEAVWRVLTDYAAYTEWDSGVLQLDGSATKGSKVALTAAVSPKRPFKLTVAELDPPKGGAGGRMVWTSGMPLGLFSGARTFTLTPDGDGTQFRTREEFEGVLLNLIWKKMPDLQPSFDQFVNGMKARTEAVAS